MTMPSAGPIAKARCAFEAAVVAEARHLPRESRQRLGHMLEHLRVMANRNAVESLRRHKPMMYAYWKAIAVYCLTFRRLIRRVR